MNLANIIEGHPAESVALRYEGGDVTYGELRRRCGVMRRAILARGLVAGDRVALVIGATPDFPVAYFGALGAGTIAVLLNPHSPPAELDRELEAIGAVLVLYGPAGDGAIGAGGGASESLVSRLVETGRDILSVEELFRTADAPSEEAAPPVVDCRDDAAAAYLFTSGTAGAPKAAVLTHGSLRSNITQVEGRAGLAAGPDDVGILAVPPFHILGLNAVLGTQLAAGGRLVMLERFDPKAMLDAISAEGVTILAGVPQLFAALADFDAASGNELASVRLACSGGAPLSEQVAERFEARYGVALWQGYGLTEASPAVTFPDVGGPRHVTSVGRPLPGVELRVVDSDGDDVEPGDPGEVLVRGPNLFAGYFEDAVATAAALDGQGWLHTGDIAVMADDGSLSIVDRRKDLIIVSGFNVFPAEVEQVLEDHVDVAEAAVIGVPDPAQGESVRAFVVPVASSWPEGANAPVAPSEADLVRHCARHLARYKCPSSVTFLRELPHGLQGKVLRRAI